MKRRSFFLTELQVAALEKLHKKTGLEKAEHVRRALDAYLKKVL